MSHDLYVEHLSRGYIDCEWIPFSCLVFYILCRYCWAFVTPTMSWWHCPWMQLPFLFRSSEGISLLDRSGRDFFTKEFQRSVNVWSEQNSTINNFLSADGMGECKELAPWVLMKTRWISNRRCQTFLFTFPSTECSFSAKLIILAKDNVFTHKLLVSTLIFNIFKQYSEL